MPGLGTTFGRGGATTFQQDLQNSDCILIMGSNMAENHPVGFQWVMEARERGAKVIHVDPRFTRTSAMATQHVKSAPEAISRSSAASSIISSTNERWFDEYVKNYTNAPVIIDKRFEDTEDLEGVFSGYNAEHGTYDLASWQYEGMTLHGAAGTPHGLGSFRRESRGSSGRPHRGRGEAAARSREPPHIDRTLQTRAASSSS